MQDPLPPDNNAAHPPSLFTRLWKVPHFIAVPFGILCIIIGYLLYPASNATIGYHIGRNLVHTLSYLAILAALAALLTAILKRRSVFGYRTFALLFAVAAFLDVPTALVKRSVARQISEVAAGLRDEQHADRSESLADAHRTLHGSKPYPLSRLEYLALKMEVSSGIKFADGDFALGFVPLEGRDTILIYARYLPSADQEIVRMAIANARELISVIAEANGWQSWLKVEEKIEMATLGRGW
jgi:hypothetical protein